MRLDAVRSEAVRMSSTARRRRAPRAWLATLPLLLAASAGCAERTIVVSHRNAAAQFEAEPNATGARMWLEVDAQADEVVATVHAADLGEVFGYAAHLEYDTRQLVLRPDAPPEALADALADGQPRSLVVMMQGEPGRVRIGATRKGPELGEADMSDATAIATIPFRVISNAEAPLKLTRVVVRRADGSYVPTSAFGGELVTTGDR